MTALTVVKEFTFDAAHHLPGYKGNCACLHGHTYRLQVGIKGKINEETGMVCDFASLKKIVHDRVINILDHSYLNEIQAKYFPNHMPTAENMVWWIAYHALAHLPISFIRLYETPTSYAEWHDEMFEFLNMKRTWIDVDNDPTPSDMPIR